MSLTKPILFAFVAKYSETILATISVVILARLLTPEEIGVFSVAAAAMAISGGIRDFGLGSLVIQSRDVTTRLLRAVFWVGLGVSTAVALAMVALAPLLAWIYRDARVAQLIEVIAIGFLLIPFSTPAFARIRRELDFVTVSKITVVVALVQMAVSVGLAAEGFGPFALAWGHVANIATCTLLAFYFLPQVDWMRPGGADWRAALHFGSFSAASSSVGEATRNGGELIVGRLAGLEAVALFSRAQGVVDLFNRMFQDAITLMALPAAASHAREGGDIRAFYLRATALLTVVAWPFFLFLLVVCDEVIVVLFGDQWRPAIVPAQILCIARVIGTVQSFVPAIVVARGDVRLLLRAQLLVMAATIACIAAGATVSLAAIAAASCVAQAAAAVVFHRALNQLAPVAWRDVAAAVWRSAAVAGATLAASLLARWALGTSGSPPIDALAVALAAALAWLLAIALTRHPIARELLSAWEAALGGQIAARRHSP